MTEDRYENEFDWIAFSLVCLMILISAWALTATEWTDYLYLVPPVGLMGAWAGIALARSRFPGWLSTIFAAVYGFFMTGWQLGRTLDPALSWLARAELLIGRLGVFFTKIFTGETNEDPFVFVLLMTILYWVLGVLGGWTVFRRRAAWTTIVTAGLPIVLFTFYYYGVAHLGWYMAAFSLVALILAARLDITSRYSFWTDQRARVPEEAVYRVSLIGFIVALAIVALAWGGPAFAKSEFLYDAWETITLPFEGVREGFENAFNTIEGRTRIVPTEYGDTLSLTAGTQPLDLLVMTVEPATLPERGGRFYWRSRVYDEYNEFHWKGPTTEMEEFDPREGQLSLGPYIGREQIEVIFVPQGAAIELLYLPSQPIWVDRTSEIEILRYDDSTLDVLRMEADRLVREGEVYRTIASVASPSIEQLRNAGADYPAWVLERNLQLPGTVTQRTRDLAVEITEGLETPYAKALAITLWLRQNMQYSRLTEQPPLDQDPIDWFLFDYQVGFCNYYASAEVILLRSLGIPARLAAGYARGEYVDLFYEVNTMDSHAWPEIFFPGVGWVEFEPTVSQPILSRPETFAEDEAALFSEPAVVTAEGEEVDPEAWLRELLGPDESVEDLTAIRTRRTLFRILSLSILGGAALAFSWIRINPASWAAFKVRLGRIAGRLNLNLPPRLELHDWEWDTATGRMYAAWSAWLKRLGLSKGPWETPLERAHAFAEAMPESAEAAWFLVDAYMRERFGGEKLRVFEVRTMWKELQPQLWRAWLLRLLRRGRR
jgi:transglutaminase-like putative cysteine protease